MRREHYLSELAYREHKGFNKGFLAGIIVTGGVFTILTILMLASMSVQKSNKLIIPSMTVIQSNVNGKMTIDTTYTYNFNTR